MTDVSEILTRKRFLVRSGAAYKAIPLGEIAYLLAEKKSTFLIDHNGDKHRLDQTITELDMMLPRDQFFRLNVKYIASLGAIEKIDLRRGRFLIYLRPSVDEEVFVSKEYAGRFRKWMSK